MPLGDLVVRDYVGFVCVCVCAYVTLNYGFSPDDLFGTQ